MNAHQRRIDRRRFERKPLMRGEWGTILGVRFIMSKEQMIATYGQPGPLSPPLQTLVDALYPPEFLDVQRASGESS